MFHLQAKNINLRDNIFNNFYVMNKSKNVLVKYRDNAMTYIKAYASLILYRKLISYKIIYQFA